MIGMNRQALSKPLSKYPRLRIAPDCTFCTIRNVQPRPQETHQHFYSECIYVERLWTDIRDWATGDHGATYKKRDKILGKPLQDTYSIDNPIFRETISKIWRARYKNTNPTIDHLKID